MKTSIKRPSRYQQNRAGYELTVSGLVMGRAIAAVKQAEKASTDIDATFPEGSLQSPDAWDVVHARYDRARKKFDACRAKCAAGHTAADRSC